MCDMKTDLAKEKDACQAQIENKTAGRYVFVPSCFTLICLIPVWSQFKVTQRALETTKLLRRSPRVYVTARRSSCLKCPKVQSFPEQTGF